MNTEVMFSSQTDQWATPQEFFDKLNEEFHFTLDLVQMNLIISVKSISQKNRMAWFNLGKVKEFFVIHHMAGKLSNGFRSASLKLQMVVVIWLLCSFLHEQIQNGFTSIFTTYLMLKSDS